MVVADTTGLRNPLDSILAPFEPFRLTREDTVLLSIDLQYLDAHRDFGFGKTARDEGEADRFDAFFQRLESVVLPSVKKLQRGFRSAGFDVIHTRIAAQTRDCRDMTLGFKRRGILAPLGSKEAEILPEVAPEPGEIIFDKVGASPFNSTGIDQILRNLGIKHLVVVGVVTNGCVELTARNAADRGYFVTLVEDGCAAMTDRLHDDAVVRVATAMIQCDTADGVLARMEAAAQEQVGSRRARGAEVTPE